MRVVILAGAVTAWELSSRLGVVDPFTAPPPSEITVEFLRLIPSADFAKHFAATTFALFTAFGIALVLGVPTGVLLWHLRTLGAVLDPYLLTLRAVPTVVFYPVLLGLLGLNAWPIIVISTVMAVVPIIIFTIVALRSISPTLVKLATSMNMSTSQRWRMVLLPAATPLALPGVKQGFIYSLLATVSMEFILAGRGVGFRIGFASSNYEIVTMYAYLLVVVILATVANWALSSLERRVRRDML